LLFYRNCIIFLGCKVRKLYSKKTENNKKT
jgi:hypothetical protein